MSGIKPIMAFVLLLLIAGLACSLPGRGTSTPTPVPTLIVTVDPKVFEDQLATSAANFRETGQLSISFTEQQIISYVAQELAQQPDTPITELQISLQNGQMILTGKVKAGFLSTQVSIVFEPSVQNGELRITIVSANFGSLPLPASALEQISETVNQNLARYIALDGRSIEVESVKIADGMLTLTGKAR